MALTNEKLKDISYAIVAGFLADYIQEGVARFFHDFTNTEAEEFDHTGSILSSMIVIVSLEILREKTNIINSTIFSTGLSVVLKEMYDAYKNKKEINYEDIKRKFLTDATLLPIILVIYEKFLDLLRMHKKRDYHGPVAKVVKNIIYTFPLIVYYGFMMFLNNLKNNKNKEENKKNNNSCLPSKEKDV